jgi:hypothetical protein
MIKPTRKLLTSLWPMAVLTQLVFCGAALASTNTSVEHDLQLWTPVTLDCKIYKKWRGYFEVVPRVGDRLSGLNQLLIRPAIEYRKRDNLSFMVGYLWLSSYAGENVINEHRIWEQLLVNNRYKRLTIINRARVEQRLFENLPNAGVRLRHMLKLNYPISKRIYATAQDELFVNANSVENGPQAGIDQNRIFAGIGIKPHRRARTEIGYQYQYVNRSDQFNDQANHAIVIQSFIGITD